MSITLVRHHIHYEVIVCLCGETNSSSKIPQHCNKQYRALQDMAWQGIPVHGMETEKGLPMQEL